MTPGSARRFARRAMRAAGLTLPRHDYRARILSGEDPMPIVDQLRKPRYRQTRERRLRQAGLILARAGQAEAARRVYAELLADNPAQPLWLKYAAGVPAHDVILIERHRIAYCPVPKNASSSVKARINYLMRGTNEVYSHRYFTNVYESSQTDPLPDLHGYFSFTVVRDPIERLVSYHQKNIVEEDSLTRELESNRAREAVPARPSLEEFIERLEDYIFYFDDVHHHTLPQAAYLGTVLNRLSRVYRISETDAVFAELSRRCGVDLAPTYLLKSSVAAQALLPGISEAARAKLTAFYQRDYDLLGPWIRP